MEGLTKLALDEKDELIIESSREKVEGRLVGLTHVIELPNNKDIQDCERRILEVKKQWSKGGSKYSLANAYLPGFWCEVSKDKTHATSIQFYQIP